MALAAHTSEQLIDAGYTISQRPDLDAISDAEQAAASTSHISNRAKPFGDRIILRGLQFLGVHGVNEDEKQSAQPFVVDVDAWLNMEKSGETDNLNDTVSYTDLHREVKEVLEGPHFHLLEALANAIATAIFSRFHAITDIRVCVGKPRVAAKKNADYVGLEVFRTAPS